MKRKHLDASISIFAIVIFTILTSSQSPILFLASFFMVLCRAIMLIRDMPGQLSDPESQEQVIARKDFWQLFLLKIFVETLPFILIVIAFYMLISRKQVWLSVFER